MYRITMKVLYKIHQKLVTQKQNTHEMSEVFYRYNEDMNIMIS